MGYDAIVVSSGLRGAMRMCYDGFPADHDIFVEGAIW